jgi:hypothetical protein
VGKELSSGPNHPARNTSVEAHDGSIILGKHLGTTVSNETNRPIPQAVRLDASHVGPFAPTAPKM